MGQYVILSGNTVVNTIIADTKELAEELTGLTAIPSSAGIGSIYDEATGQFISPTPVVEQIIDEPLAITE